MPCLVLTGNPSVGKTTFAEALKERALKHVKNVEVVNEENVCADQTKSECYADSHNEKATRGALKARVDAILGHDTLVIVDSMNYIKGFRYELYCISKAQHDRHGVVWILNSPSVAIEWNEKRNDRYSEKQIEELMLRFEPPDSRNRWDNPLYRVDLTPTDQKNGAKDAAQDALQRSVYNMHSLSDAIDHQNEGSTVKGKSSTAASSFKRANKGSTFRRAKPIAGSESTREPERQQSDTPAKDEVRSTEGCSAKTLEERIDMILDSFLCDIEPLKEGISTQQFFTAEADVLHKIDLCTQQVCQAVVVAQQKSGSRSGPLVLNLKSGSSITMNRPSRTLSPMELKRLRAQYLQWANGHPPDATTEQGLAVSFIAYLEGQVV
jgi:tRNA uridine 5-carbamoylmethylation protein Kti12